MDVLLLLLIFILSMVGNLFFYTLKANKPIAVEKAQILSWILQNRAYNRDSDKQEMLRDVCYHFYVKYGSTINVHAVL